MLFLNIIDLEFNQLSRVNSYMYFIGLNINFMGHGKVLTFKVYSVA